MIYACDDNRMFFSNDKAKKHYTSFNFEEL